MLANSKITIEKTRKKKFLNVLVIENLIAFGPALQKQAFMTLVDAVVDVAKNIYCDFVELPSVENECYDLVRNRY